MSQDRKRSRTTRAASAACAGLRVLDFTSGLAGPLASMILADFGAEVIRVEPPDDDPGWDEPAYRLLNRQKKSIGVDLDSAEGRAQIYRLLPGVDVVIETRGPGAADDAGIGYDALRALNPALVYCSVTAFGPSGPFAGVTPDDGLVMAKAGIFRDQPGWHQDGRPVYRASKDASYFAAMAAVQGILGALRARDLTGQGQLVETSLLQALTCRQNPSVGWLLRDGEGLPLDASGPKRGAAIGDVNTLPHHRDPRRTNLLAMLTECADGRWIMHAQAQPHFFSAWINAIGFDWIWEDDRFRGAPHQYPTSDAERELVERIESRMKERTAQEWMDIYVADGNVCAEIVATTQEALRHPQVVEAGYVVELDDPRVGRVTQIGPLARINGVAPSIERPAPLPRAHTEEVLGASIAPIVAPTPSRPALRSPLEGITIVEAAWFYATPFATALLTEMGARVIKIEGLDGDPYRRVSLHIGAGDPVRGFGHNNMVRAMQGKESIAVNLKDERGREILTRIVAEADVFVHNFRPGVAETLGFDYETLRSINPTLVYLHAMAYGSAGPYARQPAIDPVIAAFSGQIALQAGEGNPPLMENGADPSAAGAHATAMMLGLRARDRTGKSQYIESALVVANLYANCEDALTYEGKRERETVDRLQLGTSATRRLYETARSSSDQSRWVFLAVDADDEFDRLCRAAGCEQLLDDPRFAARSTRREHRDELAAELEPVFRTRTAQEWESELLAAEVGCARADAMSHFAFLYNDPQARAIGMMTEAEHPSFGGTYWRHAPIVRFSETPGEARAFCELGEHTRALLTEFGYDKFEIDRLRADNVVRWPIAHTEAISAAV